VIVPDEVAVQLDQLELVIVHFSDDLRLPLLGEQPQLLPKIDRLVTHSVSPAVADSGAAGPVDRGPGGRYGALLSWVLFMIAGRASRHPR